MSRLDDFEPIAMDFTEASPGTGDGRERALALLLLSMADDEFVIGFRDSEWTGIAPMLEEDVAFSSIAQNEIGHARALYELAATELGSDADALAFDERRRSIGAHSSSSCTCWSGRTRSRAATSTRRPTASGSGR